MNTKLKIGSLLLILLSTIVYLVVLVSNETSNNHESEPQASKGLLDLRSINTDLWQVRLDGEWEFVPNKLVDTNFFEKRENQIYVPVPSLWVKYDLNGQKVPKHTSATYRMVVKLPPNEKLMAIKTNNIRMSNQIFINGELVGQSGVPKENKDYLPRNTPYIAFFNSVDEEVEIIVHVSNFDYSSGGGILSSIYLGDAESIHNLRVRAMTYDWIIITAFLIASIYFAGFFFHFRKDKSTLYLSLFCFFIVIYTITHGEKLLHFLIPELPYSLFLKLQSSSTLVAIFFLAYFGYILREYANKKVVKLLNLLGIFVFLTIFFPVTISSQFQIAHSIYFLVVIVYVFFIQAKAILNKITGASYLFMGTVSLISYFVIATLNIMGNIQMNILPPTLPFFYLLMLALFMAKRFSDTYKKNEDLSMRLLEVDKFKDEFLTKTSHEFKTPLHGILAILQNLKKTESNKLTSDQQEKIILVISIVKRLSSLVNDVLDLAKIKRRDLRLHISNVDVHANTFMIIEVFAYMLQKDIKIVNLIERDTPHVKVDENRLRQILYNLIDNAVKYTEKGTIEIRAKQQERQLIISVKDTGVGIDFEQQKQIFMDYERISSPYLEKDGVGLGLSITKQLIQLHGGEIWVDSSVGEGSTFSFSLPLAEDGQAVIIDRDLNLDEFAQKSKYTFPSTYGHLKGKKVIVADDNHLNLRILIEALKSQDYYIVAVDNGADVLKQLALNQEIDLVILDIMMPGLSGYEVCQEIRKTHSLTELPVLMLTAAILPEDMVAAFNSGANDFLHKPIDLTELQTRIQSLITVKETASAAKNMEVAFLHAQIKPHFIYNVLNSILSLSYFDIEKTRTLILNFATFLRGSFIFLNTDKLIPLRDEIMLVNSYVEIEKARYPDCFQFISHIDVDSDSLIPPLIIQPLVENAIRHGIKGMKDGKVTLLIKNIEEKISIQVTDNGHGMSQVTVENFFSEKHHLTSSVALLNIKKRINQFGGSHFHIESEKNKGTTITLIFPQLQ